MAPMVRAWRLATRSQGLCGDRTHGTTGRVRLGVYTLAGIIRFAMPYLDPGSLSDAEAQQLAAFVTSKPRPSYPFKD